MIAYDFLKHISEYVPLPVVIEGQGFSDPSNRDMKRWLETKSVVINGQRPGPKDEVQFPITELVFFPKGRRRTYV